MTADERAGALSNTDEGRTAVGTLAMFVTLVPIEYRGRR